MSPLVGNRTLLIGLGMLLVASAVSIPAQGTHPTNPLQPGDRVTGPVGQCTLDFVFDGQGSKAGKVYFGIAAHCIEPGNSMSAINYNNFGTVVYDDDGSHDFGLIEVNTASVPHVSAAVKGHPGMPTGFTTYTQTALGDVILFSGYGLGFSSTTQTQEERVGTLYSDGPFSYCGHGPVIFGDSGGPVLHQKTGRALGIVSALTGSIPPCSPWGSTVEAVITKATADGFPIALRTA